MKSYDHAKPSLAPSIKHLESGRKWKMKKKAERRKRGTFEFTTFLSFPAAAVDPEVEAISRSEGKRKRLDRISRTIN